MSTSLYLTFWNKKGDHWSLSGQLVGNGQSVETLKVQLSVEKEWWVRLRCGLIQHDTTMINYEYLHWVRTSRPTCFMSPFKRVGQELMPNDLWRLVSQRFILWFLVNHRMTMFHHISHYGIVVDSTSWVVKHHGWGPIVGRFLVDYGGRNWDSMLELRSQPNFDRLKLTYSRYEFIKCWNIEIQPSIDKLLSFSNMNWTEWNPSAMAVSTPWHHGVDHLGLLGPMLSTSTYHFCGAEITWLPEVMYTQVSSCLHASRALGQISCGHCTLQDRGENGRDLQYIPVWTVVMCYSCVG